MSTAYEIPTSPNPQTFTIALSGVQYRLTLKWNAVAQLWVLDIADANDVPLLCGVPLVTGADLLEPYAYMNFGGKLYAMTDNDPDLPPSFTTLGKTGHLYWITA